VKWKGKHNYALKCIFYNLLRTHLCFLFYYRDSLIAHGGAAFIQETFFDMSDVYQVNVCNICGCIISTAKQCRVCKKDDITKTNIPYCTKLLFQELQALGVKINISTKP
jgi:DNA-directed RNA polymerase II subunit RPB2